MNINATLFIQGFNFFIAYLLLRTLLFKPVYQVIQQEQAEKDSLRDVIVKQEHRISRIERELEKQWLACCDYFAQNRPAVNRPELIVFKGLTPDITPYSIEKHEIQALVQKTERALVEKIGHIHD